CRSDLVVSNVAPVYPPSDFSFTVSNYFVDPTALSIEVMPTGDYEYKVDEGSFQESESFSNLDFGPHVVTVRDTNQCGSLTKEIFFVNYPKFFTPNGDGYNDVWNIKDLDKQLNSKVQVFDRFGRLLKEIFPSGTGWDGTYNQNEMPSSDYWFIIYYNENNENKEFRSHFSLKR
ncbi:MAG: T9SS type B sorting domain-containing protein, partial [Flavobacterium sp.]